jgi:hypothetical protein
MLHPVTIQDYLSQSEFLTEIFFFKLKFFNNSKIKSLTAYLYIFFFECKSCFFHKKNWVWCVESDISDGNVC